jgi:hypothetical protein
MPSKKEPQKPIDKVVFVQGGQVFVRGVVIELGGKRTFLTLAAAQQLRNELQRIV